jgi:sialate O-acetylesterase
MKFRYFKTLLAIFLLLNCLKGEANVRLPQLVSNGMVLQRDAKIKLWGWADAGEQLQIKFNGKRVSLKADKDGNWAAEFPAMRAGGPFVMQIDAGNHITISDILIGDVWFFSGQSNMTILMERVKELYPNDIATANYPQIRNFFVPTLADVRSEHKDLPPGKWIKADPKSILDFGAVAFFMTRKLYYKYHVPMGIINSSVGGTPIQAWISSEAIGRMDDYTKRINQFKDSSFFDQFKKVSRPALAPAGPVKITDAGLKDSVKWYSTAYTAKGWHNYWLPGYWADQGIKGLNGVVWFRKEINLPAAMAGKAAKLYIGRIIDADEAYVNGQKVGNTTYQYPPRRYSIPTGLLKAGKNLIVVRVTNTSGKGGFVPEKRYELTDGQFALDLRGDWQYRVGEVFENRRGIQGGMGSFLNAQNEPTGLYNSMVHPAIPYRIKGFVWYQGESNVGSKDYGTLLKALITDWRQKWAQGDLPFLVVQLPNFSEVQYSPAESGWAEIREQQLDALTLPRTAIAVTIDAGEWNDIHPLRKEIVGNRLALAAQTLAYNDRSVVSSGPVMRTFKVSGSNAILTFDHTGGGLVVAGDSVLSGFAIAGEDKRFVWAEARIKGNDVILSNQEVMTPKYVRYAWADNPESANLYNKEGLPASPFRTDKSQSSKP